MLTIPMAMDCVDGRRVTCDVTAELPAWTAAAVIDALSTGSRYLVGSLPDAGLPGRLTVLEDGRVRFRACTSAGTVTSAPFALRPELVAELELVARAALNLRIIRTGAEESWH